MRRLFALFLRLYPRRFRGQYAESMLRDLDEHLRRERVRGGPGAATLFALRGTLAVIPSALRVRLDGAHAGVIGVTDVGGALRSLRRAPGFSGLSVLILALGVGGATLIFSVLYGVLLAPLPYADAGRIAVVWTFNTEQGLRDGSSYLNMEDWAERSRSMEAWGYYYRPAFSGRTLMTDGEPFRIDVGSVSSSFFDVLGVQPLLGRVFTLEEERQATSGVVIGESLWRDRFAASDSVVGEEIVLDGDVRHVVGVLPASVELPWPTTAVWEPHSLRTGWPAEKRSRGLDAFVVLGRLAPGVTLEAAETELRGIASQLRSVHPENRVLDIEMSSLLTELTGKEVPKTLWLLQAAALLVLLAVGANVSQLWTIRSLDRRGDLAVRLALGARRGRLAGTLLAEGVLLAVLASAAGVVLAWLALDPLLAMAPDGLPRRSSIALQPVVVALTFGAAVLLGTVAALVGAALALRGTSDGLALGRRSIPGRAHGRLRATFVVGQVSVATVLLASAGLFARSLESLGAVDLGMDAEHLMVARVELSPQRFPGAEEVNDFHDRVLERVRGTPGVLAAGGISDFLYRRFPDATITPEDRIGDQDIPQIPLMTEAVVPGALDAMGVSLIGGRVFRLGERRPDSGTRPVVVSQAVVDAFWPESGAVGRRFQWGVYGEAKRWNEVVGVVADVRRGDLSAAPLAQVFTLGPNWQISYVVRTSGDPMEAVRGVRSAMTAVDPTVPIVWVANGEELLGQGLSLWRLRTLVAVGAAGLVGLLALLGMYGLLNEAVLRRRFEIGMRMALGAVPRQLRNQILGQGVVLAAAGVVLGVLVVMLAAQVLAAFLFGVEPADPRTLAAVAGLLGFGALAVSWLPARTATRLDPVSCLSSD